MANLYCIVHCSRSFNVVVTSAYVSQSMNRKSYLVYQTAWSVMSSDWIGWCWKVLSVTMDGTAQQYLVDELFQPLDLGIRSALTSSLPVRRTRLSTVDDRAFLIAAARTWNTLSRHLCQFSVAVCFCSVHGVTVVIGQFRWSCCLLIYWGD